MIRRKYVYFAKSYGPIFSLHIFFNRWKFFHRCGIIPLIVICERFSLLLITLLGRRMNDIDMDPGLNVSPYFDRILDLFSQFWDSKKKNIEGLVSLQWSKIQTEKSVTCAFNCSDNLKMLTFLKHYISASISISGRSWQFNPIKGNRTVLQCQSAHPSACPCQCHSLCCFIFTTNSFNIEKKKQTSLNIFSPSAFPSNGIFKINCLRPIIKKHSWVCWLQLSGCFLSRGQDFV